MTKANEVAKIWSDWNERKITGEMAIHKIQKIFPRATLKDRYIWQAKAYWIQIRIPEGYKKCPICEIEDNSN